MNFRRSPAPLLLPLLCAGLLTTAVQAQNPFKAIGAGLKKLGSALTPSSHTAEKPAPAAPPKALPATPKTTKKSAAKTTPTKKTSKSSVSASSRKSEPQNAVGSTVLPLGGTKDKKPKDELVSKEGAEGAAGPEVAGAEAEAEAVKAEVKPLGELPFATPVMGRKGCVHSPFAEDQGMVDVAGIPAGAKVKCPYTGKIFRVP